MRYFFFLFFISITYGYSQSGSVTYTALLNFDSANINQTENVLYFTQFESIYSKRSDVDIKKDSNLKETTANKEKINIGISDSIGNQYYKDLRSSKFTVRESLLKNLSLEFYIYEDEGVLKQKWSLKDEFKNISGYKCQKATLHFRGRRYEAWFTSEIPLPFGPWKLGGLPGLILEAYDLTKEISFVAEKITIPDSKANLNVKEPQSGERISHKEYVSSNTIDVDKITQSIMARMPEGSKIKSVKTKKNVLELEYNWKN